MSYLEDWHEIANEIEQERRAKIEVVEEVLAAIFMGIGIGIFWVTIASF